MSSKEGAVLEGEASPDKPAVELRIWGEAGSPQKIELPIMCLLDLEGLFFFKQFLERLLSCLKALGSNTPYTYQHSMWHFLLEQSDSRLCDVIHVGRKNIATDNVRKSGREDEVECANLRVFSIWVLALGLILPRRSEAKNSAARPAFSRQVSHDNFILQFNVSTVFMVWSLKTSRDEVEMKRCFIFGYDMI